MIPGKKRRRQTTSFKKTSSDDVFLKVVVTTFKKSSLSDNICNVVHRVIDVDCACWHDSTVTVSLFHARFPWAREQQNTATTGHLSVLKPLNPSTPLSDTIDLLCEVLVLTIFSSSMTLCFILCFVIAQNGVWKIYRLSSFFFAPARKVNVRFGNIQS